MLPKLRSAGFNVGKYLAEVQAWSQAWLERVTPTGRVDVPFIPTVRFMLKLVNRDDFNTLDMVVGHEAAMKAVKRGEAPNE